MDQELFNLNYDGSGDNNLESEDPFQDKAPYEDPFELDVPANPFGVIQQIKKENIDCPEQNETDYSNCLNPSYYMPCTNGGESFQADNSTSTISINNFRSPISSNVRVSVNDEDSLNTPNAESNDKENRKCTETSVQKARRGRWRKGNPSNDVPGSSSSPVSSSKICQLNQSAVTQRGRGRGRGIRRGYKKHSSETTGRIGFTPPVAIKEESIDPLNTATVAPQESVSNLPQSESSSSKSILKIKNTDNRKDDPAFKVRTCHSVARRSRGTNRYRASICKNGLLCRQHDVLAPISMMVDNCLNSLNLPYFAPIQLMNYGDQIFDADRMQRNGQSPEDENTIINGLGDLDCVDTNSTDSGNE